MYKRALVVLFSVMLSAQPSIAFTGEASWYGPGFHGKKMANGERFNQNAISFAHPSLELGTLIKVTNLKNGKTICGPVLDRGPYAKGRVLDASKAAAIALGYRKAGHTPIEGKKVTSC